MLDISTVKYPRHIGVQHKIEYILGEDLMLEQWVITKGTKITTFQTGNFGWVIVPKNSIPTGIKRIFKY